MPITMDLVLPVYTALTASVIMLLQTALMATVPISRLRSNTFIGDGSAAEQPDSALLLAIRRHGNLAENSGIYLIVLLLLEINGTSATIVMAMGAIFVAARLFHALGLTLGATPNAPRFIGATTTMLLGFGLGGYLLYNSIGLL